MLASELAELSLEKACGAELGESIRKMATPEFLQFRPRPEGL